MHSTGWTRHYSLCELHTGLRKNGTTTNSHVSTRWTLAAFSTKMHPNLWWNQWRCCVCRWGQLNKYHQSSMARWHLQEKWLRIQIPTDLRRYNNFFEGCFYFNIFFGSKFTFHFRAMEFHVAFRREFCTMSFLLSRIHLSQKSLYIS